MHPSTDLEHWIAGGRASAAGARVVVLEHPRALAPLRRSGWLTADTRVFVRSPQGFPPPVAVSGEPRPVVFSGSFAAPGGPVVLEDGYLLHRLRYSEAQFGGIEAPTELRVWDHSDFSDFLRDFDTAWETGVFAGHLTNPLTVLADAQALVGLPDGDDPHPPHRLFVDEEETVRVSPTGRPLGRLPEPPEVWERAARRWRQSAAAPGEVALGEVVDDVERRDAVADRPGLARYLRVLRAHRTLRRSGRQLSQVSGFGGRLQEGLPRGDRADPVDSPVLARAGAQLWYITAIDGRPDTAEPATAEQIAVLECEVLLDSPKEREAWAFRHLGTSAQRYRRLREALLSGGPAGQVVRP